MLGIGADDYGLGDRPTVWLPTFAHEQARGLIFWACARQSRFVELVKGRQAIPGTLSGTRTLPTFDVVPGGGLCAQSERTGVSDGECFDFGLPGPLDGLQVFTLAYWVFPQALAGAFWGQGDGSTSTFCETGATTGPYFRGGGDYRGIYTEVATVAGWQHLVWSIASDGVRYYRNGVLSYNHPFGLFGAITAAATYGLFIGGEPAGTGGGDDYSTARWADFRVYNRGLTATEIWALYDPGTRWALYDTSVDYVWSDPVGAPPGGFSAYWARQRSGLVGAGGAR